MGIDGDELKERVEKSARFCGLKADVLAKSPFDLSGGQKRRAAIAGIIAMRPELLILDEPAAGLDPRGRDAIFNNIVEYQKKSGSTVLIVSHSMEDMARYCDRLIVMSGAKILLEGECREIFTRADELSAVGLDVPQITRLMLALKEKGIELDTSVFTVEEAFEEILRLYQDK
jgi:energy-coupling factor transport system ATP-binding protein